MSMVCILVRCTMMSSTCRLRRSSTPPSIAASPLATAPPMVCSWMVPRISSCAARMLAASSRLVGVMRRIRRTMNWIAAVSGREENDDHAHDRRDEQRHAVGERQRVGLGQHGGEDDDQQRHDRRGVGDAGRAHHHHGDAGGKRGRQHVDQRVAEQHGADHLGGLAQQPVDEAGLGVALLLQRMHARARGGGERRLAGVEERRQDQQHDDGCKDEADIERHGFRSRSCCGRPVTRQRASRSACRAGAAGCCTDSTPAGCRSRRGDKGRWLHKCRLGPGRPDQAMPMRLAAFRKSAAPCGSKRNAARKSSTR